MKTITWGTINISLYWWSSLYGLELKLYGTITSLPAFQRKQIIIYREIKRGWQCSCYKKDIINPLHQKVGTFESLTQGRRLFVECSMQGDWVVSKRHQGAWVYLQQVCVERLPTCLRWFLRIVHSGSGRGGMSSQAGGVVILLASRSTNHTSSGSLLEGKKLCWVLWERLTKNLLMFDKCIHDNNLSFTKNNLQNLNCVQSCMYIVGN